MIIKYCDICKKKYGAEILCAVTMTTYSLDQFFCKGTSTQKEYSDICIECANAVAKVVNDKVNELKDAGEAH